jgi:hypothetical protein
MCVQMLTALCLIYIYMCVQLLQLCVVLTYICACSCYSFVSYLYIHVRAAVSALFRAYIYIYIYIYMRTAVTRLCRTYIYTHMCVQLLQLCVVLTYKCACSCYSFESYLYIHVRAAVTALCRTSIYMCVQLLQLCVVLIHTCAFLPPCRALMGRIMSLLCFNRGDTAVSGTLHGTCPISILLYSSKVDGERQEDGPLLRFKKRRIRNSKTYTHISLGQG